MKILTETYECTEIFMQHKSALYHFLTNSDKLEALTDFIFLGSKITADGDCSHEIKRHLLHGRKAMTNPDNILKSRDITLLTKIRIVRALIFQIFRNGCESWTIKKAE